MEEIHRKILQRNRTNLVRDLDPLNLYDGLLEKEIFTQDMIEDIRVRQLFRSRHWVSGSGVVCGGVVVNAQRKLVACTHLLLFVLSELWDQTRPGQTVSPGLRDPWESGLSIISGMPSGDGSAQFGRAPAEWSSSSSTTACSTHSGCSPCCLAPPNL